ncbi:HAD family hydrolase, partial [Thermus scotoductus]|uniref:HAD family hydrolase n=1 Tax=Thermus scotoductus TaxID=37636 RepID=UPI003F50FED0
MVQLVFVDVDGTLVGKEGVPACVWPAVEALQSQGVRLSLITGRPGRGHALAYARRLDPMGLHVFESGAVVLAFSRDPPVPASARPTGAKPQDSGPPAGQGPDTRVEGFPLRLKPRR